MTADVIPINRRAESPRAAIKVLRNFIATLRADGVTRIELVDLEAAVDRVEEKTLGREPS